MANLFLFAGTIQGLHNIHGTFNVPNMPGSLGSRNSTLNSVPSSGVQQPSGNLSSGRFASNNLPVALSQVVIVFSSHITLISVSIITITIDNLSRKERK